jgi:hypothetical protein
LTAETFNGNQIQPTKHRAFSAGTKAHNKQQPARRRQNWVMTSSRITWRITLLNLIQFLFLCNCRCTIASPTVNYSSSFVFLADLHLGEGCNSSTANYTFNDTNCYSVRDLNATVSKINALVGNTSLIIVGGDITASAQTTEFLAAQQYLNRFESPFIATIGNHDIWSYDEIIGDRTAKPKGDQLFSRIFHENFERIQTLGQFSYPNVSSTDASMHAQSWTFAPGKSFSSALQKLTFIAPDFNGRTKAPPPCPGHSPIGGCGVMGNANLNNVTNGSWSWFEHQLSLLNDTNREEEQILFLVTHQPFRCRVGVPDWYFCFSKKMKQSFRTVVQKYNLESAFEKGSQLSGHQHRWFQGLAFDEWPHFRQFEVSAVKGDVFDAEMSSSFAIFHLDEKNGTTKSIERWWRENNTWTTCAATAGTCK